MTELEPFSADYKDQWKHIEWHLAVALRNNPYVLHWAMALKAKSIVEVGAGSGRFSLLMKRLLPEARVVATDIDPKACEGISRSAKAAAIDIEVIECDLRSLPFPDRSFDICHSGGVMEHFSREDLVKGMEEQLRVAKGVVVLVPLVHWFLCSRLCRKGDELIMTKVSWLAFLQQIGRVLDFTLLGYPLEEIGLMALLTRDTTLSLPLTEDLRV